MRIAQLAPLAESVPPKLYGGTERVVAWLVDELVELGHDVTLFASGDSRTSGKLHPVWPRALRLGRKGTDPNAACALLLEAIAKRAKEFDVIHAHIDWLHLPLLSRLGVPFLTTMHGRLDLSGLSEVIREFPETSFVSISDHQRLPLPDANWIGTIQHGFPTDLFRPSYEQGSYLVFLGRLSAEKGPEDAIRIARSRETPTHRREDNRAPKPLTLRSVSSLTSTGRTSSSSGRSAKPKSSRSWPRPPLCCFQSIGGSLSVLS
jgi:glycosyltransferase involved in cell wall biosynthesis